jgi:hypothetical protein
MLPKEKNLDQHKFSQLSGIEYEPAVLHPVYASKGKRCDYSFSKTNHTKPQRVSVVSMPFTGYSFASAMQDTNFHMLSFRRFKPRFL